jgi:hypothetical protein
MKPREKVLLVLTAVALVVFIGWRMGGEAIFESVASGSDEVVSLEREFEDNLEAFEEMYVIERDFAQVGEFPRGSEGDLKPALAFTQQVSEMCRDLGFEFPPIRPEVEEIEGVEDYELVNVAIRTEGTFQDTIKLLKTFHKNGLIFRDVDLQGTRDKDIVTARVTVARIAQKETRKRSSLIQRPAI